MQLVALKKQTRALKNKASAMRCREKKRRKMEDLEQLVEQLSTKLRHVQQENERLQAALRIRDEELALRSNGMPRHGSQERLHNNTNSSNALFTRGHQMPRSQQQQQQRQQQQHHHQRHRNGRVPPVISTNVSGVMSRGLQLLSPPVPPSSTLNEPFFAHYFPRGVGNGNGVNNSSSSSSGSSSSITSSRRNGGVNTNAPSTSTSTTTTTTMNPSNESLQRRQVIGNNFTMAGTHKTTENRLALAAGAEQLLRLNMRRRPGI